MSRIEEALRRSGTTDGVAGIATAQQQFESPWAQEATPSRLNGSRVDRLVTDPVRGLSRLKVDCAERLASTPECDPVLAEQFRQLSAVLHKAQLAQGIKVVMVTSAVPADGKTMTAINLAYMLSDSYKRGVLLIDADLRRPAIGVVEGAIRTAGLSEALKSQAEKPINVIELTPTLTLLPAGAPDPDPTSGLTSSRMRLILEEAADRFDWVILDVPPLAPVSDASLLAEMVDGAIFVVRSGWSQFPLVQKAIDSLGKDKILGVVLNAAEQHLPAEYASYYGAYRSRQS